MIRIALYDLFETLIDKIILVKEIFSIDNTEPCSTHVPQL